MIQATDLSKRFKKRTAVDGVSLHVHGGEIFGLLGPNAAGKTTVIRMLCGVIDIDEGEVTIDGMSVNKAKSNFGYVAQHFGQYEELSVWENIQFYAHLYNVTDEKRLESLLEHYDLFPFKHQLAGALSGGYQRRLALVCALVHDPKVLFLDEPTAGIDPVTRKILWDDFYRLSSKGKTLFVTTHYMEEAQRCHQLAFLSSGKIVAKGSPDSIKQFLGDARVYAAKIPYIPRLRSSLLHMEGMVLVNQFGNELRIVVTPAIIKADLIKVIHSVTGKVYSLELTEPNLEDVFIALTQEQPPKP
jgi:ABC-type multidrug transport system ATPase subunit